MAITTNSSISVNPGRRRGEGLRMPVSSAGTVGEVTDQINESDALILCLYPDQRLVRRGQRIRKM
jgi:hypothetical protein